MPSGNNMQRGGMRVTLFFALALALALTGKIMALEPISALDDGFSAPSGSSMEEASFLFPGSESFVLEPYALIGYTVPFGMEELAATTFSAGMRAGTTGLSLSWNGSGGELYRDEQEKIGISRPLVRNLHAGVRLVRTAMHIRGFGDASTWSGDAGMVFRPVEAVCLAVSRENIAGACLGESKEPLAGRSRAAMSWSLPGSFSLLASWTKIRGYDPSWSAGCTIGISDALYAGAAAASEPARIEFMSAVVLKRMKFIYRGSYHSDLGFSHGFTVGWYGN
jgi:hypothetical protein